MVALLLASRLGGASRDLHCQPISKSRLESRSHIQKQIVAENEESDDITDNFGLDFVHRHW